MFACYAVDDLDAARARIEAAGGIAGAPSVEPHGRVADCVDDQGTPFAMVEIDSVVAAPRARPVNGLREGDLSYATFEVRDTALARAFYGAVLGWRFTPGRVGDGWQIPDVAPMAGLHGGHDVATGVPMFRVDDIAAAVDRVRAAGGTATEPERQPYGVTSDCVDDQGTRFHLGQL